MSEPRTNHVGATIEQAGSGGFVAIASNGDLDRDNERIMPGCFSPLPATVPIHTDHTMRAASVVARGRPYYVGDELRIDARFTSTNDAQEIRAKVLDGTLDSISIVFRGLRWETIEGVRTCVKGELLAADIVSVPSNAGARILSTRSVAHPVLAEARRISADAVITMARLELTEAKALLRRIDTRDPIRRRIDDLASEAVAVNEPVSATVRRFLKGIR